jgi:hypothetical protein
MWWHNRVGMAARLGPRPRLSVPHAGGWRAWGVTRDEFGRQLAKQESTAAALHVDSEVRRGRNYVRVVIVATVDAADAAEALDLTWWTFRKAAGEDLDGWALADAEAEVRPKGVSRRGTAADDDRDLFESTFHDAPALWTTSACSGVSCR